MIHLTYASGTLVAEGLSEEDPLLGAAFTWDARVAAHRAPAIAYADAIRRLHTSGRRYEDRARNYAELTCPIRVQRSPRNYQQQALAAWKAQRCRGVVVLPTGAGKTLVAMMAIADRRRDALVITPTLDLVRQWYEQLRSTFGPPIGVLGGGDHDVQPITVSTYESAHLHVEHLGNRFGLVVFDECHHLPSPSYSLIAQLAIAPFRLGLTATPERADGRDALLTDLLGPIAFRQEITELAGDYLAQYAVEMVTVELSPEERTEYEAERALYRDFLSRNGLRMKRPEDWSQFLMLASRSREGLRALRAYRRQKELTLRAEAKFDMLSHLLSEHRRDRAILFTQDNATAYAISRRFLLPVITHQTGVKERSEVLAGLASGAYSAIVTSKVLNEGVDVPEANVAIIISGSGSVREHVQRLGRVLRMKEGKQAILYELVTGGTGETFVSERRREHDAYR